MSYYLLLWFDYPIVASINLTVHLVFIDGSHATIARITKVIVHIRYVYEFPSSTEIL